MPLHIAFDDLGVRDQDTHAALSLSHPHSHRTTHSCPGRGNLVEDHLVDRWGDTPCPRRSETAAWAEVTTGGRA